MNSRLSAAFGGSSKERSPAPYEASQAKLRTEGDGDLVAGLDVAGPGEDETVLCVRQGPRIIRLWSWAGRDARGDVLAALLPFKARLKSVNVDSVGIGYYMAQHLRDDGLPVTEVRRRRKCSRPRGAPVR